MSDTLAAPLRHEQLVKHSRFLVQAGPVDSAEAAMAFIAAVSDADATHNCWAWRVGATFRSSDDGEPGGSAGRPILAAIDGAGFDRIAVVVTRWFGGIKLGVGGLVRAYGGSTASALRQAPRVPLVAMAGLEIGCGFDDLGHVHAALAAFAAQKDAERFDSDGAVLQVQLPAERRQALEHALREATRGRVHCRDAAPAH
ncbi:MULTISPECIES: YigZ family protein [Pseudoxanthomonas]|uniref:YigZ family protein n=1 Tax=Pseudoxanthomonas winnipegensis TaxID=2480810 RepID=A0AAW8GB77_9GAMM|nr:MULTISPECIES: YigZ family protein [Pseudoxanthomonas]MDQ1119669.1 putative YigZ family protein [Pseudoxanthomonas winnipegensis]MDQ1132867.1 putative YigZ family protein [Pseudoxanthomonas winnipegensis]MDR6137129.1 putative YigZ family protein [Pseudoxanthomonas sp. SORGH_AS_0997]